MPAISLIIPVYNVEKYLLECLDSASNQTFQDIEIICIEDKSTDKSSEILKQYAQKDKRIKILTGKGNDVSAARNIGIQAATGEYLSFLDSDDFILPNHLTSLYESAKHTNCDIVCNNQYIKFYNKNKFYSQKKKISKGIYDITPEFIAKYGYLLMVWGKLYRRESVSSLKINFPEGLMYEDVYFLYCLLPNLSKAAVIDNNTYYYRQREGSLMWNVNTNQKTNFDLITIFHMIFLYYKENNLLTRFSLPINILKPQIARTLNKKECFYKIRNLLKDYPIDVNKLSKKEKKFIRTLQRPYWLFLLSLIKRKIIHRKDR